MTMMKMDVLAMMMWMMVVVLMIVFHLQNVDEVIGFSRVPWQLKDNEFYSAADCLMDFFAISV